jgi:hypothetical protein
MTAEHFAALSPSVRAEFHRRRAARLPGRRIRNRELFTLHVREARTEPEHYRYSISSGLDVFLLWQGPLPEEKGTPNLDAWMRRGGS